MLASWVFTDIRKRGEGSGVFIALALLAGIPAAIIYSLVRLGDNTRVHDLLTNEAALPHLCVRVEAPAEGSFQVESSSASGQVFRLEWRGDLSAGSWSSGVVVTASSDRVNLTDPDSSNQLQRFYRVVQAP